MKTMPTMTPSESLYAVSVLMEMATFWKILLAKQDPPPGEELQLRLSTAIRLTESLRRSILVGPWSGVSSTAHALALLSAQLPHLEAKQYELSQSQPLSKQAKSDSQATSET